MAHLLADAADDSTMAAYHKSHVGNWTKPDGSLVTEADVATEQQIRQALAQVAPGEEILGEELSGANRGDRWIIDPIDGTENFSRRSSIWGTLIAWESQGRITDALVSAPVLGRRWWASLGRGAFTDGGRRLSVSDVSEPAHASICYGGTHEYDRLSLRKLNSLLRCFRTAWGWGNFWGHVQVAEGIVDVAISNGTAIWDAAAPALIVAEAQGSWSDFDGGHRLDAGAFVTSNTRLHDVATAVTHTMISSDDSPGDNKDGVER
ncbi:MAG TPA: histidinol phosphatase [Candidatus Stackebrandtia faecavium]|nr:histidinol phosphatase [Candidatus Stackebrandtia faecavium]